MNEPVLEMRDLRVRTTERSPLTIVDGVDIDVRLGETVALVGESGSGKTMAARSVLRLLPANLTMSARRLTVADVDVQAGDDTDLRRLRGETVGMVFQDPMASFNPALPVGRQVTEPVRIRQRMSRQAAHRLATEVLGHVGISNPEQRCREYPHQFSGGMLQRAMIAMALINRPRLVIADEPTTALDATLQVKIVELLRKLQDEIGAGILVITHDLGLVAELADRAAVMYGGRILETGPVTDVFGRPAHPYTRALLDSRPEGRDGKVRAIPGEPATPATRPAGCVFHPRCRLRDGREKCVDQEPALELVATHRSAACHFAAEMTSNSSTLDDTDAISGTAKGHTDAAPVLTVSNVSKRFVSTSLWFARSRNVTQAVDDVTFAVHRGESLGLVGESGSGKSTLGRLMVRLLEPDSGSIDVFDERGAPVGDASFRRTIQWVHQDPYGSLNPRMTIAKLIGEVLSRYRLHHSRQSERIAELLGQVGLPPDTAHRFPHQLSGGQRQRVAIARALAVEPSILVLDEPLSALDVSIQAQVISLLTNLRAALGLSYVLISHDLNVVKTICDRVAVMCQGKIVEIGTAEHVYGDPQHPYTQALLSAMLTIEPIRHMTSNTPEATTYKEGTNAR